MCSVYPMPDGKQVLYVLTKQERRALVQLIEDRINGIDTAKLPAPRDVLLLLAGALK